MLTFEGHSGPVLSVDFSPLGNVVASGACDNTCKVWDMRRFRGWISILSHSGCVGRVKHRPVVGDVLVTSGDEGRTSVLSSNDYAVLNSISVSARRVMGLDVSPEYRFLRLALTGFDHRLELFDL